MRLLGELSPWVEAHKIAYNHPLIHSDLRAASFS